MPRPGQPDIYRTRARAEGYVARAVYKLKEVDEKYHLFQPGQRVLDLGCSPGSWLQYIVSRTGPKGLVVGVDVNPLAIPVAPPLYFVPGEVTSLDLEIITAISPVFDVVVSDLAPKTTGMRQVDQQRSLELAFLAWDWARKLLREGGHFLVKVFEGPDTPTLTAVLKAGFNLCRHVKPAGSRPASREIYLLGLKKRSAPSGARASQSGPRPR
ncbi:MAG: RlmE family RNA methyltransferase [Syntrophobacterales bacterium]|jgi:23S rRNA (uridine2552-2'-O)-methyltransferase|nr:RlmE family RNA methyltransferase [Syntrophobacterales bacterium]